MGVAAPVRLGPVVAGVACDGDGPVPLFGVDGVAVALVATAPPLLAQLAVDRARAAGADPVPPEVFARAGELFATERLAGDSPAEYCARAAAATGVPLAVFTRGLDSIAAALAGVAEANAAELPAPPRGTGYAVHWVPRGRVLGVIAPSNHPEPHAAWVRALAAGYAVVVRPGGRDPFTPLRLAAALVEAGLPADRLAILPGGHEVAERLVRAADRSIVYGGDEAVRRWAGRPDVLVRGPGRSKALVCAAPSDEVVDHLALAVAGDGGVRCTNVSVVRTPDVAGVAARLARRLALLPSLPPGDPAARLPSFDGARADRLRADLGRLAAGMDDHCAGYRATGALAGLSGGAVVARPVVLATTDRDHPDIGTELSMPFVVVAPWTAADGLRGLGDSLVLTLLGADDDLVRRAVREPSVRKVVVGPIPPWQTRPGLPHDGSLANFLLEPKALLG